MASSSSGELPGPQPFVTEGQTRKGRRGVETENKGGEKRRRLVNMDGSQNFSYNKGTGLKKGESAKEHTEAKSEFLSV